jgi:hypothetical protein
MLLRTWLHTAYGHALGRITVHQERYLISRTPATLLLGNLDTCRLSEIAWPHVGGGERFSFDNERVGWLAAAPCAAACSAAAGTGLIHALGCCCMLHMIPSMSSTISVSKTVNRAHARRSCAWCYGVVSCQS